MAKLPFLRLAFAVLMVFVPISLCAPKERSDSTGTSSEGKCNFDKRTFCKWKQDKQTDNFDWSLKKGRTPSSGTGPESDHTTRKGKKDGYYAYIETSSPRRRGDIANLMSGPFSGVQCLKFAYSMVGRQIGTLKVFLLLHGNKLDIWSKTGEQRGSDWKTDNVTLYGNNYYIMFEAVAGGGYLGDIAIDDIHFSKGSCKGESFSFQNESGSENGGRCSFDLGLCDWANDLVGADKSAWRLSSYRGGGVRKTSSVAKRDHGGKFDGAFVYATQLLSTAKRSRLISREVCGAKCVEFFYFMEKFKRSEFRLSTRREGMEDRIWFNSGGGEKFKDWTRAVIEVNAEEETCYQLIFEANLHVNFKSIVGLDDILIANGSCCPIINTPNDTAKANCDFDKDSFCNWKSSPKSTFEWSLGRGRTISGNHSGDATGPTADFSGRGKYAYIESSEPQMPGDKATLVSHLLVGQQCMQFKYHMNGRDIGSLSIYRRGFLVWKESGDHGNQWLHGQIDFDCSIKQYHVEIEATVLGWRGDIAIDELTFTPGPCPIKPIDNAAAALRPTTASPAPLPPLPSPYSICKFYPDMCGWTNALDDDGDWILNYEDTPSKNTGPQFDSDGNGFYVYMEASDLFKGQEVRLESQELYTPICLHFHYHMYGKDVNELRLEQRNLKDNSTTVLWSKKGEQEDNWHSGLQDFYGDHYTVSFVAVRGDSYLGDIALDEIAVNEAAECEVLKEDGPKQSDVAQNPKEGNCDFESNEFSLCKWANVKGDSFDWTTGSGSTPSSGTGPDSDHTKGKNMAGRYIFIEASSPRRRGQKAMLLVKLEGRSFCMRFWYHMYGSGTGSLSIMRIVKEPSDDHTPAVKDFKQETVEWKKIGDQGKKWVKVEQDLEVDRSFKRYAIHWIAIVGTVGNSYSGDIAVDDIEFSDGRCSLGRPRST